MVKQRKEEMKTKQESEVEKWNKDQKKIDKKRDDLQKKHKEEIIDSFKKQQDLRETVKNNYKVNKKNFEMDLRMKD